MAIFGIHSAAYFQAVTVLCVLAIAHVGGRLHSNSRRYECPTFSCGEHRNVSYPFRRQEDPAGCGVPSYELTCSDTKATIRINTGTYYVVNISYTASSFVVVDASLDMQSSCPLPGWDQLPYYPDGLETSDGGGYVLLRLAPNVAWANFLNCSQAVRNNHAYRAVDCLSTSYSYVYVYTRRGPFSVEDLEASCGYLALIPYGGFGDQMTPVNNVTYADVVRFMRDGFEVRFPIYHHAQVAARSTPWQEIIDHIHQLIRKFHKDQAKERINDVLIPEYNNVLEYLLPDYYFEQTIPRTLIVAALCFVRWTQVLPLLCRLMMAPLSVLITVFAFVRWILGICLFVPVALSLIFKFVSPPLSLLITWILVLSLLSTYMLVSLSVLVFLAHKYWKALITIDAVEKFLRMQLMLGPTRYAYTDIIAITSHFRDKLGKGGYGSVYKGVLHPGNVHVAVKMLGNSNCFGEDFISEVSTIGRIHHVNVVRLVGFCSEDMRRALVYEYMPNGSLDKYIFSSEKSFSWDKLNEIALGIARGINYLHQGCDMQIVHFDIKPYNILLDRNFIPKIADFGLAKLCPRDNSFVPMSAMRGTIGYIAPEMISRCFGAISSKSDVYSFGMLLLEMAGGRRNANPHAESSSQAYYPSWVYSQLTRQEVGEINAFDMHELEKKLCIVGLWCIQMRSHDRPSMSEVVEMLEAGIDGMEMPPRPFFCDDEHVPAAGSYYMSSEMTAISEDVEDDYISSEITAISEDVEVQ